VIKKAVSFTLYFLVLFFPFVWFPLKPDPFEFPKAIFLIFFVFLSLGLYLAGIMLGEIKKPKLTRLHHLLILFFIVQLISSFFGAGFSRSFWGQPYRYQGLLALFSLMTFSFLVSQAKKIDLKIETFFSLLAFSGLMVALLVIFQGLALFVFKLPVYTFSGRMIAFLGNPNFAAGYLVLSFISFFFYRPGKMSFWLGASFFFAALLLTQSRGGLIAFILVLAVFAGMRRSFKKIVPLFFALPLLLIFFPQRPASLFENRIVIWQKSVKAFSRKPLLGWGRENFEFAFQSVLKNEGVDLDLRNIRVDRAHNEILEILVSGGLVSLVAWFFLVVSSLQVLWRKRNHSWAQASLITLAVFLFLSQLNVVNFNQYLVWYLGLGIAASF